MIASLRFNGLDVDVVICESLLASPPSLERAGLTGADPSKLKGIRVRRSKLFLSTGLVDVLFSCPLDELCDDTGVALPLSDAWLNTRFIGLFGDVRLDNVGRAIADLLDRADERNANFRLGTKGEGVYGGWPAAKSWG